MAPTRTRRRPSSYAEEAEHEEHGAGQERWMVSYADMITLLLVLFIVLFAMSQIDQAKYDELKDGLMSGFGKSVLSGATPAQPNTTGGSESSPVDTMFDDLSPAEQEQVQKAVTHENALQQQRVYGEAKTEVHNLLSVWQRIKTALRAQGLEHDVEATIDQRGLVVSLVSRHIVFPANLAGLTERGTRIVNTVAPVLRSIPEPIEVDGHTNQVPVKPKYFPSDWDLSAARAITVLRLLQDHDGLPARRLSATGYGHTKPLIKPSLPGSQAINKRVDIVVVSQASPEAKARFQQVLQALHIRNASVQGGLT